MVVICSECRCEIEISQSIPEHRGINNQGKEVLRYRCKKCGRVVEVIK